jgi:iron complex outermembrane receptor protein
MNFWKNSVFSATLITALGAGVAAHAQDPAVGAAASVAAADAAALAASSEVVVTVARNRIPTLTDVAGNTAVISADRVELGRAANIADVLKFQPGLLAQAATGEEATRFSMRGSGIIRGAGSWGTGIQFLFNGLTLTTPEGSPYEYYEGLADNYTEIYPGANAFEFSPSTQGGAINFVPHTGYDSTPLLARAEGGSFGYNREQVSSGQVIGPLDYYISATHFGSNGFRQGNGTYSQRIVADVGYKLSDNFKTRILFEYAQQNTRSATSLTLAQVQQDPTQSAYTNTPANYTGATGQTEQSMRREKGSTILGDYSTLDLDAKSDIEGGFLYKNFPLRNQGGGFTPGNWDVKDLAVTLRYKRNDQLFDGHENNSEIAWIYAGVLPDSTNRGLYIGPHSATTPTTLFKATFGGYDSTLLVKDDLEIAHGLWLTTGLASIWQQRVSNIQNFVSATTSDETENFNTVVPRIGARYDITPHIQLYGNYSGSDEVPIAHQLPVTVSLTIPGSGGLKYNVDNSNAYIRNQTQQNLEAGVRGEAGIFKWDVAIFHTYVEHEILTQVVGNPNLPTVTTVTANSASPTSHEGLEGTLDVTLWRSGASSLVWRSALTVDRFQFLNDPVYHNNQIPAVPEDFYQGELNYVDRSGFYAGLTTESVFSKYPTDFYNQLYVPSYIIYGARLGYRSPDKKWELYLQGDNLGDAHYVAATSTTARGAASSAVFSPGETRNFSIGLTHAFF